MTRFMLLMSACLLAVPLACGKSESKPAAPAAKAPAASAPAAKAPADATGAAAPAAPAAAVAATPINANCPMTGDPIAAKGGTATLKGQTIGFCCKDCSAEFAKLDDAGKVAALAKNGTKLPE